MPRSYPPQYISWYVDSGAGQSITSCSEAFCTLTPCAILVVGVAGTMSVHGMGTARFITIIGGKQVILTIHNCLLCHGETFNLLSVSQLLRSTDNSIIFREGDSKIHLKHNECEQYLGLREEEGLYKMSMHPLNVNDKRHASLPQYDVTSENDPRLFEEMQDPHHNERINAMALKAPSSLGVWTRKVLWMGERGISTTEYDDNLKDFCKSYFSPISQPEGKKTYQVNNNNDMADLSVRFMGIGNDRLAQTIRRSKGLTPCKRGDKVYRVPPHNFPQGKWAKGKTPKVSKDKVKYINRASIAEVVFTDTFETKDNAYRYGQAFVD